VEEMARMFVDVDVILRNVIVSDGRPKDIHKSDS